MSTYQLHYDPPSVDVRLRDKPRPGRIYLWIAACAAAAVAFALAYLWLYASILELNYEVTRHKRELDRASQERVTLKADLYRRRSIAEIDVLAHQELRMRAPVPGQIIMVEDRR